MVSHAPTLRRWSTSQAGLAGGGRPRGQVGSGTLRAGVCTQVHAYMLVAAGRDHVKNMLSVCPPERERERASERHDSGGGTVPAQLGPGLVRTWLAAGRAGWNILHREFGAAAHSTRIR